MIRDQQSLPNAQDDVTLVYYKITNLSHGSTTTRVIDEYTDDISINVPLIDEANYSIRI